MAVWRAIVVWLLLALPAAAQEQTAPQILIINSDRLYSDTLYGRRLKRDIEELQDAFQQENDRIAENLIEQERSLTLRRPEMTPEAFTEEVDAFDMMVQEVRRAADSKNEELREADLAARAAFEGNVQGIIANVMLERGATMVMEQRSVILSIRSVNITDDVIARIDAVLGEGPQ